MSDSKDPRSPPEEQSNGRHSLEVYVAIYKDQARKPLLTIMKTIFINNIGLKIDFVK